MLVKRDSGRSGKLSIIQLVKHKSGKYYSVVTSFTARYPQGEKLLWRGAQSQAVDSGIQPTLQSLHQQATSDIGLSAKLKEANKSIAQTHTESVLLHEVQHAIQSHEDFARCGSPNLFDDRNLSEESCKEIDQKLTNILSNDKSLNDLVTQRNQGIIKIMNQYGAETPEGKIIDWDNVPYEVSDKYFEILDKLNEHPEYQNYIDLELARDKALDSACPITIKIYQEQ